MAEAPNTHELMRKLATDPEFRAKFLSNPKQTLEAFTGHKLPDDLEISVHEPSAKHLHISIPPLVTGQPLDERELEAVSGGSDTMYECTDMGAVCTFSTQCRRMTVCTTPQQCIK